MLLPNTILWELPLVSALTGYGFGYFLPRLAIQQYYQQLEQSIFQTVSQKLTTDLPLKLLQTFLQQVKPDDIERWLLAKLFQFQQSLNSPATLRKLYRLGDDYIPLVFQHIGKRYLQGLDTPTRDKITSWMGDLYEQLFPQIHLQYHQAEVMMDVIFGMFLTPITIRQMLADGLLPLPSDVIERAIKQQLSGFTSVVAKFVDLKPAIDRFKLAISDDPDAVLQMITQLIDQFELREKLAERLSRFRWQELSNAERDNIKLWLNRFLDEWLQDDPDTLCQLLVSLGSGSSRMLIRGLIQTDWQKLVALSPAVQSEETAIQFPKTALHVMTQYAWDALQQNTKTPPSWLKNAGNSITTTAQRFISQTSYQQRQATALQLFQPFQQRIALISAGIGLSYGLLNLLVLAMF